VVLCVGGGLSNQPLLVDACARKVQDLEEEKEEKKEEKRREEKRGEENNSTRLYKPLGSLDGQDGRDPVLAVPLAGD